MGFNSVFKGLMTVWLLKTVSMVCYFVTSKNMELLIRRSILLYWRDWNILCNKYLEERLELVCRYLLYKIRTKSFLYYGILRLSKSLHQWGFVMDCSGFEPRCMWDFPHSSRRVPRPTQTPVQRIPVFPEVKWPGHNAYHPPPSSEGKDQPRTGHESLEWDRGIVLPFL